MYGTAQMQLDTCTQGTFCCNEATSHNYGTGQRQLDAAGRTQTFFSIENQMCPSHVQPIQAPFNDNLPASVY